MKRKITKTQLKKLIFESVQNKILKPLNESYPLVGESPYGGALMNLDDVRKSFEEFPDDLDSSTRKRINDLFEELFNEIEHLHEDYVYEEEQRKKIETSKTPTETEIIEMCKKIFKDLVRFSEKLWGCFEFSIDKNISLGSVSFTYITLKNGQIINVEDDYLYGQSPSAVLYYNQNLFYNGKTKIGLTYKDLYNVVSENYNDLEKYYNGWAANIDIYYNTDEEEEILRQLIKPDEEGIHGRRYENLNYYDVKYCFTEKDAETLTNYLKNN